MIVEDVDEGFKRIYEHCLPLENARSREACGVEGSVNKVLIINQEAIEGRINIILVNGVFGF